MHNPLTAPQRTTIASFIIHFLSGDSYLVTGHVFEHVTTQNQQENGLTSEG